MEMKDREANALSANGFLRLAFNSRFFTIRKHCSSSRREFMFLELNKSITQPVADANIDHLFNKLWLQKQILLIYMLLIDRNVTVNTY